MSLEQVHHRGLARDRRPRDRLHVRVGQRERLDQLMAGVGGRRLELGAGDAQRSPSQLDAIELLG
jgi:hypothetical protein